ncbi:MAG: sensor histidine kinase [Bacillota bacterium]
MQGASIRTRLTWAFVLVAAAAMTLVMLGFNLAFWGTVQQRIESGHGLMRGPMMGQGRGASIWETLAEGRGLAVQVSLVTGALGLVFAGAVSYVVAERLTRSVRRLADTARTARPGAGTFAVEPQDPAEMLELAGALNRMTERLQQEDEARRNLFADIAHELRHPIALLRGRLEMMQDGVTPVSPESLSALHDEVIRLGRLVADMRELSLAEVGKLSLNLHPVDLAAEIATTLENFEPIASAKGVRLVVETGPLPAIHADPDRIRQILANLLSNAVRHTPEAGRITLWAAREGAQVAITVADSGAGIDPEDLAHLFDRFYRADKSRTRATGGTGLGLAIARSLARLHGGDLTAQNRPAGGALFTLTLPVTSQGTHSS